jgi:hypothetical protein
MATMRSSVSASESRVSVKVAVYDGVDDFVTSPVMGSSTPEMSWRHFSSSSSAGG